jgi:hypothetical protein
VDQGRNRESGIVPVGPVGGDLESDSVDGPPESDGLRKCFWDKQPSAQKARSSRDRDVHESAREECGAAGDARDAGESVEEEGVAAGDAHDAAAGGTLEDWGEEAEASRDCDFISIHSGFRGLRPGSKDTSEEKKR